MASADQQRCESRSSRRLAKATPAEKPRIRSEVRNEGSNGSPYCVAALIANVNFALENIFAYLPTTFPIISTIFSFRPFRIGVSIGLFRVRPQTYFLDQLQRVGPQLQVNNSSFATGNRNRSVNRLTCITRPVDRSRGHAKYLVRIRHKFVRHKFICTNRGTGVLAVVDITL